MPLKFNPFTAQFDLTGSGGGASYIDGEVATYNDLPLDGTAPLNSAWLVRSSSGIWPFNKPGGIYIRTATGGSNRDTDYTYAGTMPDVFSDAVLTIYDEASTTRTGQFNLGSVTAGQNRVLTWPDASGRIQVEGQAIGNTTPAAITGTVITANTTLALPSSVSGSPAAGDIYRNANTLRYRDSTNTERILLSGAGNLENLTNTATARTNLGITQLPAKTDVYTSNGTWTKPAGAKLVHYFIVAGGGGGGSGRRDTTANNGGGGGGGAGGSVSVGWIDAASLADTVTVTIGAGGGGGAGNRPNGNTGVTGTAGGASSFGGIASTGGGGGGNGTGVAGGSLQSASVSLGLYYATSVGRGASSAGSFTANATAPAAAIGTAAGGGGGGGKQATTYYNGANGGAVGNVTSTAGGTFVANAAGNNGATWIGGYLGTGGGGGSPGTGGQANNGGNGGLYGGGGGGGSACDNDAGGEGKGGDGANGIVIITTYF